MKIRRYFSYNSLPKLQRKGACDTVRAFAGTGRMDFTSEGP